MSARLARLGAVAAVVAVIVGLSAWPAAGGVTTPTPGKLAPGSALFAIDCDSTPGQLYSIDPSNADATTIGTRTSVKGSDCAYSGAWDPKNDTMYYIVRTYANGVKVTYLASVDLSRTDSTSGESAEIGQTVDTTETPASSTSIEAIAVGGDGSAYAIGDNGDLYDLDLSSGDLTKDIGWTGDTALLGFAYDPVDSEFYVLDNYTGEYSTIDVGSGALGPVVGTLNLTPVNSPESLQIDTNGTFWVENDGVDADVWSFNPDPNNQSSEESGVVTLGGVQFYTETILLAWGAPTITAAAPPASVTVAAPWSYTMTTTGIAPIAFSITAGALPPGLSLDASTGVISGTPSTVGSYSYTVTAANEVGVDTVSVTQSVAVPAPHFPIVSG